MVDFNINELFEPNNLSSPAFLVGVYYDGDIGSPYVKLYEPISQRTFRWTDRSKHRPYCLWKTSMDKFDAVRYLNQNIGGKFIDLKFEKRFDALQDKEIDVVRIITQTPTDVAGRSDSIRNFIDVNEADIRYSDCFIWDTKLEPGMPYRIWDGQLIPVQPEIPLPGELQKTITETVTEDTLKRFFRLLESPVPSYKRIAVDIEVYHPSENSMPTPYESEFQIIACSLASNDGVSKVLLLRRTPYKQENFGNAEFCDTEQELIGKVFEYLWHYDMVLTFNGDEFDFRYLYNRALRLGFSREEIPIQYHQTWMGLRYGIHIDLMRLFANMSLQVYAFDAKYKLSGRTVGLDEVGRGLVNQGKVEHEMSIGKMTYAQLADYGFGDADLTLKLTTYGNDTVMRLLTSLSRVSYQPMEDVARGGASSWIKSLMLREHRVRGWIIPRAEREEETGTIVGGDIMATKNIIDTKSEVEGKKFRGAMVIDPVVGLHWWVSVLDFASLYPSIIETWNLGYETVRCPHKDCETVNPRIVPFTTHWVCKKNRALTAEIIGSLKDIRVQWYKPKGKTNDYYKVVEQTIKVFMNATYGVFASDKFPLYCPPMGESVTQVGRDSISRVIEEARNRSISVFYGDTDSIFIEGTKDQIKGLTDWAWQNIHIELQLDKSYVWLALSGRKKNYLGLANGKLAIKGMTGKKRHTPGWIKYVFDEVLKLLKMMEKPEQFEPVKKAITYFIQAELKELRAGRVPVSALAFTMGLQKDPDDYKKNTPIHVKVARQIQGSKGGDVIHFVKVLGPAGAREVSVTRPQEINVSAYEAFLKNTLIQVLDCLGMDWKDMGGDDSQTTLFGEPFKSKEVKKVKRVKKGIIT
jgi:DNA polymerase I